MKDVTQYEIPQLVHLRIGSGPSINMSKLSDSIILLWQGQDEDSRIDWSERTLQEVSSFVTFKESI